MKSQRLHMTLPALLGAAILVTITPRDAYSEWAARGGHTVTPESSIEQPEHVGLRAHTNFKMFVPAAGMAARQDSPEAVPQAGGPPFQGYFYETPASLACVYKLLLVTSQDTGCNPNTVMVNPAGGASAIAIVDAYHYPTAESDLVRFSAQFGLPSANLQVVFANGRQPKVNADWNIEAGLDIQWAHAMAPQAKIYLVEAASSSFTDLLNAVSVANALVKSAGGGRRLIICYDLAGRRLSYTLSLDTTHISSSPGSFISRPPATVRESFGHPRLPLSCPLAAPASVGTRQLVSSSRN